jgi:CG-1 domain.
MSNSRVEFNMLKLQETARTRWFKTLEVQQILKNVEDSNLSPFVCTKLPERPTNGSFFIVDASQAGKKWKQDGYSYVKRNNGVGFREDVVYLKIGGVKVIICAIFFQNTGSHVLILPSGSGIIRPGQLSTLQENI